MKVLSLFCMLHHFISFALGDAVSGFDLCDSSILWL